jgi:hypothetical protein
MPRTSVSWLITSRATVSPCPHSTNAGQVDRPAIGQRRASVTWRSPRIGFLAHWSNVQLAVQAGKLLGKLVDFIGAGGGDRTHTAFRPRDFKLPPRQRRPS